MHKYAFSLALAGSYWEAEKVVRELILINVERNVLQVGRGGGQGR